MRFQFNKIIYKLSKEDKKKVVKTLNEQFGIQEIDGELIKIGNERIRLFTGELTEKEYEAIIETIRLEGIGLAIIKEEKEEFRITIEATQIFGEQATKSVYQLNDEDLSLWMHGEDLQKHNEKKGFVIVKHNEDFLGMGKIGAEKVSNYIPKERRLKHR